MFERVIEVLKREFTGEELNEFAAELTADAEGKFEDLVSQASDEKTESEE